MHAITRRAFLGAALGGLASVPLLQAQPPATGLEKVPEEPAYQPSTLFLTWQRDPTTTMTVQWVGARGETSDTNVYYTAEQIGPWQAKTTIVKPFAPDTDLKVFRTELTGLAPGTDYRFQIGKHSPTY